MLHFSYHFCPYCPYYNINELGKKLGKVKNSLIANHRVIWINIIRKNGPYVRVKQPSTAHLFHCIVDLECLHANCVYHSMGGSLVWFVCTLVWSNCKRAINVSITGTEMDKYLPNPPTYQTNSVPSQFIKQILPRYCETRIWELRNIWHEGTFFFWSDFVFNFWGDMTSPKSIWATCPCLSWLSATKLCNSFELM